MDEEYITGKDLYKALFYLFVGSKENKVEIDYESILSTSKFSIIRDTLIINRLQIIKDTVESIKKLEDSVAISSYVSWINSFMDQCILSLARMDPLEFALIKILYKGNHLHWIKKDDDQIDFLTNKFKIEESSSALEDEWIKEHISKYFNTLKGKGDNGFIITNKNTGFISFISMSEDDIRMAYNVDRFIFGINQSKENK